jgi:hypothetical protein
MSLNRVRLGAVYTWQPNLLDVVHKLNNLQPGDKVRVTKAGGMRQEKTVNAGHCFVEDAVTGQFIGLVHVNSLVKG